MKTILLILLLSIVVSAQGEFINEGSFGFSGNYGYITNNILSGSGGSFGVSALGKFDMGVEFINVSIENENSSYNIETSSFLVPFQVNE